MSPNCEFNCKLRVSQFSIIGAVVNDCHAEIVSRRCLIDYLYCQLYLHLNEATADHSIFKRPDAGGTGVYSLKENIEFHLFINTAPCGDARIFSPHEEDANLGIDKHPNRKARGQLRTKIESGEGTIPAKNSDGIQTWFVKDFEVSSLKRFCNLMTHLHAGMAYCRASGC